MFIELTSDLENLGFTKEVHLLEYIYLIEKGIVKGDKKQLMKKIEKKDKLAKQKYEIVKYFRDRKYILRFSKDSDLIRIYQKGIRIGEDRTIYVMKIVKKLKEVSEKDLITAREMRKTLIIATYDERPKFFRVDQIQFE